MNDVSTQLLIIGSGPAGLSAAIYAARSSLSPVLVHGLQPGGQLTITTDVENYPGFASTIQGPWLMEQMTKQAEHVGTKILYDYIEKIDLSSKPFIAIGGTGTLYRADSVIIASGAQAKWLGLDSEKKYQGYGVSACATCDGFFYKDREVIVVGGGNSAVEEALYLTNHASKVTVIHRRDSFRAERILQDKLFKNPKIKVLWNHKVDEIIGTDNPKSVVSVRVQSTIDASYQEVAAEGVFIAIGHSPNTILFKDYLNIDDEGYIITEHGSTKTNIKGVFAAGDVQDKIYRQAITAAGTGCMAALDADKFLRGIE